MSEPIYDKEDNVSVKLFRTTEVENIIQTFYKEDGNDSQRVVDLFAAAMVGAEVMGWDINSIYQVISQQQPIACKVVDKLTASYEIGGPDYD